MIKRVLLLSAVAMASCAGLSNAADVVQLQENLAGLSVEEKHEAFQEAARYIEEQKNNGRSEEQILKRFEAVLEARAEQGATKLALDEKQEKLLWIMAGAGVVILSYLTYKGISAWVHSKSKAPVDHVEAPVDHVEAQGAQGAPVGGIDPAFVTPVQASRRMVDQEAPVAPVAQGAQGAPAGGIYQAFATQVQQASRRMVDQEAPVGGIDPAFVTPVQARSHRLGRRDRRDRSDRGREALGRFMKI